MKKKQATSGRSTAEKSKAREVVDQIAAEQHRRGWTNQQMVNALNAKGMRVTPDCELKKRTYDNWLSPESGNLPRPQALAGLIAAFAKVCKMKDSAAAIPTPGPQPA